MPAHVRQKDPRANCLAHRAEIDDAIRRVLDSGSYILGEEVGAFEREFASYIGVAYAVGVASGTDALHLALRSAGVGADDAVFTVAHTAVATAAAIELAGARPVWVDIEPVTYTMDPDSLEEAIHSSSRKSATVGRPRAIVPVHLYGHPADMPAIVEIARRHKLTVVEDCAQAHGAALDGRKAGAWGRIAAFSFYPTKNLGALGDGGIVVTDDPPVAEGVRRLREYGWKVRYVSETPGTNSRLDELQAAILRVKLRHLDADNARCAALAATYAARLGTTGLVLPRVRKSAVHAWHQYVVRTPDRDGLRTHLERQSVGTAIHYPVPVHAQPAYRDRVPALVALKQTESAAAEILSLPLYPELGDRDVEAVAAHIAAWA